MAFRFTDTAGDNLTVEPGMDDHGAPVVVVTAEQYHDNACVHIPLDHVEQLIAGVRTAANQPPSADWAAARAEGLREAAEFIDNDDDCGCGGCDTCIPRALAADLRRMADEAQAAEEQPALLTGADRQFLTFALDQAADEMSFSDGFTDADQAALAKLRRLAEEPR